MNGKTAYLAGAAALLLAGTSAIVLANEPYLPRSERAFTKLDADSDGKVTLNELKPKAIKRFLRLDDDSDGTVTSAEIDTWLNQRIEKRKERLLGRLDKNKDGNVTRDEVDAYVDALFNGADGDHDGGVTFAEARDSLAKRYKRASGSQGN